MEEHIHKITCDQCGKSTTDIAKDTGGWLVLKTAVATADGKPDAPYRLGGDFCTVTCLEKYLADYQAHPQSPKFRFDWKETMRERLGEGTPEELMAEALGPRPERGEGQYL